MRLILLLAIFIWTSSTAQIPFQSEGFFEVDQLNYVYTVEQDVISKYDFSGKLLYQSTPLQLGNVSRLDVFDPLRPIVFYRDQGELLVLDNTLSEQSETIDLFQTDLGQIWQFCRSDNNHFWFFNTDNFELIRTNKNFQVVSRSGNLFQVLGEKVIPEYMVERSNRLYISDPEKGIYIFDIFGTFMQSISAVGISRFSVNNEGLWFVHNNELCLYNLKYREQQCETQVKTISQASVSKNYFFLATSDQIKVKSRSMDKQ